MVCAHRAACCGLGIGCSNVPRIKRWFPVSHDINSDPEVWELTDRFGVTGLRVWLELLSIGDRNDGRLPPMSDSTYRQLSIKCNSTQSRVRLVCDWTQTQSWVVCDPTPRLRNYADYHISRDAKKNGRASPPTSPSEPSEPIKKLNKEVEHSELKGSWARKLNSGTDSQRDEQAKLEARAKFLTQHGREPEPGELEQEGGV